jgi:hypothetical protein
MVYRQGNVSISGVKGVYAVTYVGSGVSNNTFYSGGGGRGGWRVRSSLKNKYSKLFQSLIDKVSIPWMDVYQISIVYNSKMDPGNVAAMEKIFTDTIKEERLKGVVTKKGLIYDDSKKYCKGVMLIPDDSLPKDTYRFDILHLK